MVTVHSLMMTMAIRLASAPSLEHHASFAALSSAADSTTPCRRSRVWTFDSGATNHMASEAGICTNLEQVREESVLVSDNEHLED
jgi:hypothetical protein